MTPAPIPPSGYFPRKRVKSFAQRRLLDALPTIRFGVRLRMLQSPQLISCSGNMFRSNGNHIVGLKHSIGPNRKGYKPSVNISDHPTLTSELSAKTLNKSFH
jgi:hypothetical protein